MADSNRVPKSIKGETGKERERREVRKEED